MGGTLARLVTRKGDVGRTETRQDAMPRPGAGEILLRLDRFSLTANNITYAAFGDAPGLNYWHFFPTGEDGFGHMPVWGFADVAVSTVDGIEPGERFYGYFPIASHVVMRPERVTPRGFYDAAGHRRELVSAYNQYTRCSTDPGYRPELEDLQALYRPLFLTSFMLADFLADNGFFGARRVLFSSASSKTAYGTAFCLMGDKSIETIAVTSMRNVDFVAGLGCYGHTVVYDDVERLETDVPALYVDFSGDGVLRERIHRHLGPALVYDCYAGSASSVEFMATADLPGPAPQFYFAPTQIRKRNTDWGPAEVTRRYNEAQSCLFAHARDASPPWVDIVQGQGIDAASRVIADLAAGRGDPRAGNIIKLD